MMSEVMEQNTVNGTALQPVLNGTSAPAKKASMLDKAVLLQVDTRRFGNSRRIDSDLVNADTDKDLVSVTKKLLDCNELRNVGQLDTKVKAYLKKKCLPSVLRKGVFILPLSSISQVKERLNEYSVEREQLVEAFIAVYPTLVTQAEMRLRQLFNSGDYPGVYLDGDEVKVDEGYASTLRQYFSFSWNYVSFAVPEILQAIDKQLFDDEKKKHEAQWQEAQEVVQDLLRVRMMGLVQGLTEKLTPEEDGKAKTFKSSHITKIDEFLSEFDALNVTDDEQLAAVVHQARELMNGIDVKQLRKSDAMREAFTTAFNDIENQLSTMIVNKPSRGISFEDE